MSSLKNYFFTSESVSEGHPDKVSDRISDMVVDSYLSNDPFSRVACETLTTTNKVVLAGMSANLCTESHMRDLVESGFNVSVVKDATAAAILPGMNGYEAALVNFRMIASHVFTTEEIVAELKKINKVE